MEFTEAEERTTGLKEHAKKRERKQAFSSAFFVYSSRMPGRPVGGERRQPVEWVGGSATSASQRFICFFAKVSVRVALFHREIVLR